MKVVFEGADVLKKSVKALSALIDEGEFIFDDEGMRLRATDPSKIAMVDFTLPKHAFKEYDVEGTVRVGLNMSDLQNIFKRAKAAETVEMSVSEDGSRFIIELVGRARRRFTLPVLDLGGIDLPLPKITFSASLKVLADVFASALSDASAFSTHVTMEATNDGFTMRASGSKGEYVLELKKDVHDALLDLLVTEEARASYPLDYLEDMVSQANKTAAISLSFSTDAPLKLSYAIGDANFVYFLAPRIEAG